MCVKHPVGARLWKQEVSLEEGSMYTGPPNVSQQQNPSAQFNSKP